jgi:hypothetical protein
MEREKRGGGEGINNEGQRETKRRKTVILGDVRFYLLCSQFSLSYFLISHLDGQTGSGKTFTMRGSDEDPGMMILCIRDIFEYIETHPKTKFTLRVSYMEVYNEEINDLLGDGGPVCDSCSSYIY